MRRERDADFHVPARDLPNGYTALYCRRCIGDFIDHRSGVQPRERRPARGTRHHRVRDAVADPRTLVATPKQASGIEQNLPVCSSAYDSLMSSHSEPSVETLTAEVRVLQVGSKPVTLSAARQLDYVGQGDIKPFGRVRIDPNPGRMIEVIGSAGGVLARSSATASERTCPGFANQGTAYRESVCPDHLSISDYHGAKDHKWTKYYPSQELYEAWLALPLIILAGLR
jgi:hypothetical protein